MSFTSGSLAFIDTNILVYANDSQDREKQGLARRLVREILTEGSGVVSAQVLSEFWVTVTKKIAVPLSAKAALDQIELLRSFRVQEIDYDLVRAAVDIHGRLRTSYWDALIVAAAVRADCRVLYTEDLSDKLRIGRLRVVNPFLAGSTPPTPKSRPPSSTSVTSY